MLSMLGLMAYLYSTAVNKFIRKKRRIEKEQKIFAHQYGNVAVDVLKNNLLSGNNRKNLT